MARSGFAAGADSHLRSQRSTNSLERALAILEFVAHKSGGLTNAEISAHFDVPTSTTSYILSRLEREGYLRRDPGNGRYEMGLKIVALSHGALRDMGLRRVAEPILHRLSSETKTSALIGVLERGRVMIVDKVEKPDWRELTLTSGCATQLTQPPWARSCWLTCPRANWSAFSITTDCRRRRRKRLIREAACSKN
jgi:IclR-like helix-turn-helix domain-containing protein